MRNQTESEEQDTISEIYNIKFRNYIYDISLNCEHRTDFENLMTKYFVVSLAFKLLIILITSSTLNCKM